MHAKKNKIQNSFLKNTQTKWKMKKLYSDIFLPKPIVNIILTGEELKAFALKLGTRHNCNSHHLFSIQY